MFWLALCHKDSEGVKLPVFPATKKGKIVPDRAMKAYRGNRHLYFHAFLTWASDGVEWSTLCPGRFAPRKEPRYPWNRWLGGSQCHSGHFWRREKSGKFIKR